jgi:hypothetical protein
MVVYSALLDNVLESELFFLNTSKYPPVQGILPRWSRPSIIYSLKKSSVYCMSVFNIYKSTTYPNYMFPEVRIVGLNQLVLWVWKTAGRPLDFSRHISFIAVSTFRKSHGKDDFENRLWKSIKCKQKISERKKTIKNNNWRYCNDDLPHSYNIKIYKHEIFSFFGIWCQESVTRSL